MSNIVIGFDFGTKKIGVAIGQQLTYIARPLAVLKSYSSGIPNWKNIESIYNTWKPIILIVGLPLTINGNNQFTTKLAKQFAIQLQKRFSIPVEMHDERFSTSEARLAWNQYYYNSHTKYNEKIDAIAAEIILNSWLMQFKTQK